MLNRNLLIVTPVFPYPLNSGGAQAQFHMIDSLRTQINISLAYPRRSKDEETLKRLWPNVNFYPYMKQRPCWFVRKYKKIITKLYRNFDSNRAMVSPYLSHSYESAINYGYVNFLDQVIQKENIEIIQFEFIDSLNLAYAFPNVKRIFVQHEIHFIRNLRFIKDLNSLSACDYYKYNMLKQQEIEAMNACNAIITLTDVDKEILKNEGVTSNIFVSPAIIPAPEETLPTNYEFCNKIIFIGGDAHSPNYEGIIWFLDNVWEQILEEKPETTLYIIGKWRERTKKKITKQYKNISMLGFIPSIAPYTTKSIMIVPILTGSGMRMKIVEAANNGVPFITTAVGVEGLNFINNEDCYIESEAKSFAKKTIELMNSQEIQLKFRQNAFNKIKEICPIEKMIKQRLDVYAKT